jgi:hypothetical protein
MLGSLYQTPRQSHLARPNLESLHQNRQLQAFGVCAVQLTNLEGHTRTIVGRHIFPPFSASRRHQIGRVSIKTLSDRLVGQPCWLTNLGRIQLRLLEA